MSEQVWASQVGVEVVEHGGLLTRVNYSSAAPAAIEVHEYPIVSVDGFQPSIVLIEVRADLLGQQVGSNTQTRPCQCCRYD
jgi:hypothetical protein